jgi:hypothetical protein
LPPGDYGVVTDEELMAAQERDLSHDA